MIKKVAVVGFGFMGMTHVLNILKNPKLRLVAIVEKDPDSIAQKIADPGGNFSTGGIDADALRHVSTYATLDACLESEKELDAVHLCVHTDLHTKLAMDVLDRGLNVFIEKPFTLDIEDGEAVIEKARRHNLIVMIGHVLRFMPPYQKLKSWVDSKEYGNLKLLSMTRYSGLPAWGQWAEKQTAFGTTGGALFDLLIHDIDFAHHVLGNPDGVDASIVPGVLSDYDFVNAMWQYKDRAPAVHIAGGNTFHSAFPFRAGYMASFENASIVYDTSAPEVIKIADNQKVQEIAAGDANEGYYNEIDYFADCLVHHSEPTLCKPESSLDTIKLCYRHIG
jgi:predicted dehydrogenase